MIQPTVSTIGKQQVEEALKALAKRLSGDTRVLVGVPKGAGVYEDGLTIATIAAVNEFGSEKIEHPGGVSYGYRTEKEAIAGKVRFLKSGEGFMELGKTAAHTGSIPARPFLRPGIENGTPLYLKAAEVGIPKVLKGDLTMEALLDQIGFMGSVSVQRAIHDKTDPPNAKSTIAKKGSANPLIDTMHLLKSITHVIDDGTDPIEEGI